MKCLKRPVPGREVALRGHVLRRRLSLLSPLCASAKELLPGDILLSSLPAISRKSKSIA